MELCRKMSQDAVDYFKIKKANGRSAYKLFSDEDEVKRMN